MQKKIAKTLRFLENNPLHPGLKLERIVNDAKAWSVRVDRRYRVSFEPEAFLPSGNPDWSGSVFLLRLLITMICTSVPDEKPMYSRDSHIHRTGKQGG